MEQRLMAFWHYDQYPYVVWGEIISFDVDGKVFIKEYGGYIIRPFLILPFEQGQELAGILKDFKSRQIVEISKIENFYYDKVEETISKYVPSFKIEKNL